MTTPHHGDDFLHDLRLRSAAEGGVFWLDNEQLAVFEPAAARMVSSANWNGLVMSDRLVDMVRRRRSTPMRWSRIRTAWLTQLHTLTTGEHNADLITRMRQIIDARLGDDVDLVLLAQDVAVQSILPVALSGLTAGESARITQDLNQKLLRLIDRHPGRGLRHHAHFAAVQIRAGLVVRRVLSERASGRRARELDLTDPIVDLLPELGMDRALDVVTAVLTAIGGPPGSAAASVLYEFVRNPQWAHRLTRELGSVDPVEFCAAPAKSAPVTHRFVKEVLRMWSPPLLLVRRARASFDLGATRLEKGQSYLVSPHMIHRHPRFWQEADTFDPDRFLPGAPHGPADRACYVPFGWAPKKCIGADIGTIQLMALCYLMCTRYRLSVPNADTITMACRFAPVPQQFRGHLALA
ncbi:MULTISPECIES: cytochrome P450 [unclassified Streptomyces]|uniref:cytochrome P450 n=1 Tax=unclassified Streptomyces TaxID=2593676 RepID=UPI002DDC6C29|nr:cytochrome P450 [Streptomyces sp. NBC_01750]WSA97971.1 cytochrome P450 [Streptomyces sp. NBC_01794]WSD37476.1 cytochrome P450 [Streptomyces sp. NBC_01750]